MTIYEDYLWLELKVESLGESVQLDLTLGEGPDWGRGGGCAREGGGGGGEDTLGQQTSQVTGLQHGLQKREIWVRVIIVKVKVICGILQI